MGWRFLILKLAWYLLALLAALGPATSRAETLNEVAVFPERADAVVRITFGVGVQYLRHTTLNDHRVEIYFQVLAADSSPSTEVRRIAATRSFPGIEVIYPRQPRFGPQKLTVRFTKPVTFRVRPGGIRAIDLVIPGAAQDIVRRPTPGEAAGPAQQAEARFAIRLESFATPSDMGRAKAVPSEFSDYAVFASQSLRDERTEHEILLGYFSAAESAEKVRERLLRRFPDAEVIDLVERRHASLRDAAAAASVRAAQPSATPAAPTPTEAAAPLIADPAGAADIEQPQKPLRDTAAEARVEAPQPSTKPGTPAPAETAAPPIAAPASATDVETRAEELMASARTALDAGNNQVATERLNQVLMLPPNHRSREAQELVGLARERNGEIVKARAEYELYLKLFPDSEGAARVRERLTALAASGASVAPRARRAPVRTVTGALSQYYYGGKTKIDTAFNTPTTVDRFSVSATDQSSLVTNLDLTLRNRTASSDNRFVLRDTNNQSFLAHQRDYNRLNAAYYDYRGIENSITARVGRQTGLTGGLPNRFDGAVAGYGFAQKWRLNAAAGLPVEYPSIDSTRHFWGGNIEFENLLDALSGNLFFIEQQTDGILDRRAVGAETRYFDARRSLFTLVDYDVSYSAWNIAMLQGTWQTEGRATFNLLLDRRRAPTLTTTNAIFGQGTTSISTLLQTLTEDQIRQQARDVTATATQGLIGFTIPLSEKWQAGAGVRFTNVGALPTVLVNGILIPAQPATGDIYSYDIQAIGNNLYSERDTNVFSATYLTGPRYTGHQLSYNNLSLIHGRWTVEPSIRYYTQNDDQSQTKLVRWMPGLRLTYRLRENVALESEFNLEVTRTVGPALQDDTRRGFFFLGYRLDI